MKKIVIASLVLMALIGCKEQEDKKEKEVPVQSFLRGQIINTMHNQIFVKYGDLTDTLRLTGEGNFDYELFIEKPTYVYLSAGANQMVLFLNPSSSLHVQNDNRNFYESAEFSGAFTNINNYLIRQSILENNTSFNNVNFMYASDINVFKDSFERFVNSLYDNFYEFKKSGNAEYDEFFELERARIKSIYLTFLYNYYNTIAGATRSPEPALQDLLTKHTAKMELDNDDLMELHEFRGFLPYYIDNTLTQKSIEENIEISSVSQYVEVLFNQIDNSFKSKEILDFLYFEFIQYFVTNFGIEGMQPYYEKYKETSSNTIRLSKIENSFKIRERISPGYPSADFSFPDLNGKIYSLDDFQGKYLYIDVWASWCGPCIREIPHLKILKERFKDKNIEIIGISVDERRADWENLVKRENLGGVQLFAGGWNNEFVKHFLITGIPRFILLDREGNIISSNADRPSQNIEAQLLQLEGI